MEAVTKEALMDQCHGEGDEDATAVARERSGCRHGD